jgi:hypothetical protein
LPRGNKGVMRSIPSRSINFLLTSDRVTQLLSTTCANVTKLDKAKRDKARTYE